MSDARLIAEVRELKIELRALINTGAHLIKEEPICEHDAARFLGISVRTLQNKVCAGIMEGKFIVNAIGHRMYYKSKLIAP